MRISILTQPLGHNYGGLLQAYALQAFLKSAGCQVETLDRRNRRAGRTTLKKMAHDWVRLFAGRIKSIPTRRRQLQVLSELDDFRNRMLTMSPQIRSVQALRSYYRKNRFDVFIVGSDQVWRPRYSPCILNYYFDFLDDIRSSAKRISYAASFGVDAWEYPAALTEQCARLAQKFDAISVREQSAVALCATNLKVEAQCHVDPTLLLEPADYDRLIASCGRNENVGCLLSYMLDASPAKSKAILNIGVHLQKQVYSIKPEYSLSQVAAKDLHLCRYPGVERWLQAFRDASFVVTDSFHGTVFAVLFNKPFVTIGNSVRGVARFESLLNQLGLVDQLIESPEQLTPALLKQPVDWAAVNQKRMHLAAAGRDFLRVHVAGAPPLANAAPRGAVLPKASFNQ